MNVNTTYLTTNVDEAISALHSIVREFSDGTSTFKVGMSVTPIDRVLGVSPSFLTGGGPKSVGKMNRSYRWGVTAVYLLFKTSSRQVCQKVEGMLIDALRIIAPSEPDNACRNEVGGGGGRRAGDHHPYYYVYLARG